MKPFYPSMMCLSSSLWMRAILVTLFTTCLLFTCFLVTFAQAEANDLSPAALGSISGVVTDDAGNPLADIYVTPYRNMGGYYPFMYPVSTDISGTYRIASLPPGIYRLGFWDTNNIYASTFYSNAITVDKAQDLIVSGNHLVDKNIRLGMGGRITGMVRLPNESLPGGNIQIYTEVDGVWQFWRMSYFTATGIYEAVALPPAVYRICSQNLFDNVTLSACYGGPTLDSASNITVTSGITQANIDITYEPGYFDGVIGGSVTSNGLPQAGIRVDLLRYREPLLYGFTDANGHYRFEGLSPAEYLLEFSDPTGHFATVYQANQRGFYGSQILSLQRGQVYTDVNVALSQVAGTIRGTVRQTNRQPFANVLVTAYTTLPDWDIVRAKVKTEANGNYSISGLWPNAYRLKYEWCYPYRCYEEAYGSEISVAAGSDIMVEAGQTVSEIDLILGPDFQVLIPWVARKS